MNSLSVPTTFGSMLKKIRLENNIGLREHCRDIVMESSNYSKVENSILPPPKNSAMILKLVGELEHSRAQFKSLVNYSLAYWTIELERKFK